MTRRAEVIGDPIAHSRSPDIHGFWLQALALDGAYGRCLVSGDGLASYLDQRRAEADWAGCNVTAPLKEQILLLLDEVDEAAAEIGAVNCVTKTGERLIGSNTDLDGIAEALAGARIHGGRVALIGAGGAAKAAFLHCAKAGASEIRILARSLEKAAPLSALADPGCAVEPRLLGSADALIGVDLIINASPAGMAHAAPLPSELLGQLAQAAPGATVFDMVYAPLATPLLKAAQASGLRPVDGLVMLIGQARLAFQSLFRIAPPADLDAALRARILTGSV